MRRGLAVALFYTLLVGVASGQDARRTFRGGVLSPRAVSMPWIRQHTLPELARRGFVVGQNLPGTSATLVFSEGYPSMPPTDGNRALLASLNGVNKSMGLPAMPEFDPAKRGAADSSWVAADVDTLAGLGPAGGKAHADFHHALHAMRE